MVQESWLPPRNDYTNVSHSADSNRKSILDWLVGTNPSENHNRAPGLHELHTGRWLTRSPAYRGWLNGSNRFLWLHGIPGSGKTILASFVIEDVKDICQQSAVNRQGWAYYYCY